MVKLTIPGTLPGLNEYIDAERIHRQRGATMKRNCEALLIPLIKTQLRGFKPTRPLRVWYTWYEPNRMRDKDNISGYGRKVIQDSMVKAGIIRNDGWGEIEEYRDSFAVDAKNPRIEVCMEEVADLTTPTR